MLLLAPIAQIKQNTSFFFLFTFFAKDDTSDYTWVLHQICNVILNNQGILSTIIINCDLTLMLIVNQVFLLAKNLLCY